MNYSAYADTVLAKMKTVPGTSSQKISIENNKPEVSVKIDKEKMMALGLRMDQVGGVINLAFSGNSDSKLTQGQYDYDIAVKLDAFNRQSVDELKQLSFVNVVGQTIRLEQFATIERTIGPAKLERKDRISSVTVSSEVVGRPQGTVGEEIKALVEKDPLPAGMTISYEGNMKQQAEAFGSMGMALIASIIFVYLIMVALYNSYIYPFVVLFSIPVAMVGALAGIGIEHAITEYLFYARYHHADRVGGKKCDPAGGLYQPVKREGIQNNRCIDRIRSHKTSPDSDDNHSDGDWYASAGIGKWCRCRMEKWYGLGIDRWINKFYVINTGSSSGYVSHH